MCLCCEKGMRQLRCPRPHRRRIFYTGGQATTYVERLRKFDSVLDNNILLHDSQTESRSIIILRRERTIRVKCVCPSPLLLRKNQLRRSLTSLIRRRKQANIISCNLHHISLRCLLQEHIVIILIVV